MDYQSFVDHVSMPCCVMSVQKTADDSVGEIRIICANRSYKETMGPAYHDNMIYSDLVPQDNNFEDYVYRSAIKGERMHAYVETTALGTWTDQTMIPLDSDNDEYGYCQFIFEFTHDAEAERMTNISLAAAEAVIQACIKLMGTGNFQSGMGEALEVIMDASGATAGRIMLVDHDAKKAVIYCDKNNVEAWPTIPEDPAEDVITYDLIKTWETVIGVSNVLIIKDEQDMDEVAKVDPEWAGSMTENGVESMVLVPLRREGVVLGYLYVVNFNTELVVEVKELTELMSYLFGSEIFNYQLMRKLDRLSKYDVLTGMNNRRAMTTRVDELKCCGGDKPYGFISVDLNGLKYTNDNFGHEAGDRLLVQASEILGRVFRQYDLFRTGGDEFTVILDSIDKDIFDGKVARLREEMLGNADICFAIGECWSGGGDEPESVYRMADERMYEDKKAFYDSHPDLKRKIHLEN